MEAESLPPASGQAPHGDYQCKNLKNITRGLGATARPAGARPIKIIHSISLFYPPFHFYIEPLNYLVLWLRLWGNAKGGNDKYLIETFRLNSLRMIFHLLRKIKFFIKKGVYL
jgi:hypothetical protein